MAIFHCYVSSPEGTWSKCIIMVQTNRFSFTMSAKIPWKIVPGHDIHHSPKRWNMTRRWHAKINIPPNWNSGIQWYTAIADHCINKNNTNRLPTKTSRVCSNPTAIPWSQGAGQGRAIHDDSHHHPQHAHISRSPKGRVGKDQRGEEASESRGEGLGETQNGTGNPSGPKSWVPNNGRLITGNLIWLVVDLPLWKMMECSSVGMMTFPIYGKIKFMFQTTNQLWKWMRTGGIPIVGNLHVDREN